MPIYLEQNFFSAIECLGKKLKVYGKNVYINPKINIIRTCTEISQCTLWLGCKNSCIIVIMESLHSNKIKIAKQFHGRLKAGGGCVCVCVCVCVVGIEIPMFQSRQSMDNVWN